jgi:AraC-like DNA-binding protein
MNTFFNLEARKHGSILFPYAAYKMEFDEDEVILDCHWHSEIEFLLVNKGSGMFHLGEQFYRINEGEALIISGGILHSGRTIPGKHCSFEASVFSSSLIESAGNDIVQSKYLDSVIRELKYREPVIKGKDENERAILEHLHSIHRLYWKKEIFFEMQIKIHLLEIFLLLNIMREEECSDVIINPVRTRSESIKEVLRFLHGNYSKEIPLQEMTAITGFSCAHFSRIFKETVHMTPVEYLNYFRINRSVELLKDSRLPLFKIAEESGFSIKPSKPFNLISRRDSSCSPNFPLGKPLFLNQRT